VVSIGGPIWREVIVDIQRTRIGRIITSEAWCLKIEWTYDEWISEFV